MSSIPKNNLYHFNRLLSSVLLGIAITSSAYATTIQGPGIIHRAQPTKQTHSRIDIAKTRAATLTQKHEFFLQLNIPSVSKYVNDEVKLGLTKPNDDEEKKHAKEVKTQQDSLRETLKSLDVEVLSTMRVGVNGFRVKAKLGVISNLLLIPGVKSVSPIAVHRPSIAKSVTWLNTPEIWDQFGTGKNITIAIIDTGIDYLHANLGGNGLGSDYANNDKSIIEAGSFPTAKVIGGYDFAGANYNAADPLNSIPQPDMDPLDGDGHGTHVAGIAAGEGVPDKIGAGIAKSASLYALKVFGDTAGATTLTADAIEWAMDPNGDGSTEDHVDVINLSLGSPFGSPNEPSTIAVQNASELGIIVVAAAGNEGNVPYVVGSPAIATDAIAVAASIPGPQTAQGFQVHAPAAIAGNYVAQQANFTLALDNSNSVLGDLILADPIDGCMPFSNAAAITGQIVLIQRGTCNFDLKGSHAEQAGASAFVVYNNQANAGPITMAGDLYVNIPGLMIGTDDGELIASSLTQSETVTASLDINNQVATPELDDTIASFSSRGPGHGGSTFKPDLTAPGAGIVSSAVGSGDGALSLSGTSMSSPHVAGLAALMRSIFNKLKPTEIKALLQNGSVFASTNPSNGVPYPWRDKVPVWFGQIFLAN